MIKLSIAGSVATLLMSRPPVNAISDDWMDRWHGALDELAGHPEVAVLHVRSDQKAFCAGADLNRVREGFASAGGADGFVEWIKKIQDLYARIERLPQVTVAEIGGAALGGGFELALSCDLRVAGTKVKLGLPEAQLGLLPGAGGTQRLTRRCGQAVAARIILGVEPVSGAEGLTLGMVHWAVPAEDLASFAAGLAARIGTMPAAALAACKRCIAAAGEPGEAGYLIERLESRRLIDRPETRERVTAFLNR